MNLFGPCLRLICLTVSSNTLMGMLTFCPLSDLSFIVLLLLVACQCSNIRFTHYAGYLYTLLVICAHYFQYSLCGGLLLHWCSTQLLHVKFNYLSMTLTMIFSLPLSMCIKHRRINWINWRIVAIRITIYSYLNSKRYSYAILQFSRFNQCWNE